MKKAAIAIAILIVAYLLGPSPATPLYDATLPDLPAAPGALEAWVAAKEQLHKIKPGNEAEIVWANPANPEKTPVAVVYLHGFTASKREGFPTHRLFAERYGCNLYLARLSDHGIDTTEALLGYSVDRVWRTAVEAYAIGLQMGHEVIIMSTSTGGTLALRLAATYPRIRGLINFSPNIAINDPAAFLMNNPWGLQIARLVFKGNYRTVESDEVYRRYWYHQYRLEAIAELQELLETTCYKKLFEQVRCPVFNGYYYADEKNQDPVVRVDAILAMHEQLGSALSQKIAVPFPTAGNHVIACDLQSGALTEVFDAVCHFAENVLLLTPQGTPAFIEAAID